jgi:HK97 family phage major capsid protein
MNAALSIFVLIAIIYMMIIAVKQPNKFKKIVKLACAGPMVILFNDYGSSIDRSGTEALIPTEVSNEIITAVPNSSTFMRLATRLPNMSRHQRNLPVLSSLPVAYFVNGDTGLKQTTKVDWTNVSIVAEELAVIVPIPEAVIDDTSYDIWAQIKPLLLEAFGIAIDQACFYSTNKPSTWPVGIALAAIAAGNRVAFGTYADLYDDLLGEGGVLSLVEADGFVVNGHVGATTMRSKLRGVRDADGNPIFKSSMQEKTNFMLDGSDILFPENGAIDAAQSLLISGDWKKAVYSIRQDITYKMLSEAVIQDASGNIIYNLAQQDMVALRAVMRLGWQLPNPINRMNSTAATRYPFAVLTP